MGEHHATDTHAYGSSPQRYGWRCETCGACGSNYSWSDRAEDVARDHRDSAEEDES